MISVTPRHFPNVRHITINTYNKRYQFLQTHGSLCYLGKRRWIFQVSLKEPWLFPKKSVNESRTLFGWLCFYFGWFN